MLNVIEVGAEVNIDNSGLALHNCLSHSVYRLMCCPFRSVSIRPRLKVSFEDRLQDELKRPLYHTITNSRNRQNADFLAPVLGNLLLPCPHGPIGVGDQFLPYLLQESPTPLSWMAANVTPSIPGARRFLSPSGRLR